MGMALPPSGKISFSDLRTEFSDTDPVKLSDYYRGGSLVPDTATNVNVPNSGSLPLSALLGSSHEVVVPGSWNPSNYFNTVAWWNTADESKFDLPYGNDLFNTFTDSINNITLTAPSSTFHRHGWPNGSIATPVPYAPSSSGYAQYPASGTSSIPPQLPTGTTDGWIFAVCEVHGADQNFPAVFGYGGVAGGAGYRAIGYGGLSTGSAGNLIMGSTADTIAINAAVASYGTPSLIAARFDPSSHELWLNGTLISSIGVVMTPTDTTGRVRFAQGYTTTAGFPNSYFGDVVVTLSVTSTLAREKIEGYLAHKFGIQSKLPSGHTYKVSPP